MKKALACILFILALCTLPACSEKTQTSSLPDVMTQIEKQVDMQNMLELSKEDLQANYGIEQKDVKQFAAIVDATGIKADEIILLEGTDSAASNRIKEKLDSRYKQKAIELKDYLPEQYAILEKGSVKQKGNYISMIISPNADIFEKAYSESFK